MTTKLIIIPNGAKLAFYWLALRAQDDETEPSNDARRRETTRALGGWIRPALQGGLVFCRPVSLEIPASVTPDTLRAVAGLLRLEGGLELERSERCRREEDQEGARSAMSGWSGLNQLAGALDTLARKGEVVECDELDTLASMPITGPRWWPRRPKS